MGRGCECELGQRASVAWISLEQRELPLKSAVALASLLQRDGERRRGEAGGRVVERSSCERHSLPLQAGCRSRVLRKETAPSERDRKRGAANMRRRGINAHRAQSRVVEVRPDVPCW